MSIFNINCPYKSIQIKLAIKSLAFKLHEERCVPYHAYDQRLTESCLVTSCHDWVQKYDHGDLDAMVQLPATMIVSQIQLNLFTTLLSGSKAICMLAFQTVLYRE